MLVAVPTQAWLSTSGAALLLVVQRALVDRRSELARNRAGSDSGRIADLGHVAASLR
jgi:hypothetical protein